MLGNHDYCLTLSLDSDTDMNSELMAHGYSNLAAGIFGGK